MNALKMKPPDTAGLGIRRQRSDPRLGSKEREGLVEFLVNRPRSEGTV